MSLSRRGVRIHGRRWSVIPHGASAAIKLHYNAHISTEACSLVGVAGNTGTEERKPSRIIPAVESSPFMGEDAMRRGA
jgi:hypothetical protein